MTDEERDRLIDRGLPFAGGTHDLADVKQGLATGEFQEWRGEHSVILTLVAQHPQCKEAFCFLAAGNLWEIQQLYPVVMAWAKSIGCTKASFRGRPGWSRTFLTKSQGWHEAAVIYERTL